MVRICSLMDECSKLPILEFDGIFVTGSNRGFSINEALLRVIPVKAFK